SHPRPIRGDGMNMIRALLAGLLLVGLCWQQGASAQDLPPGSYLRTCHDVELRGDTLVATCLRTDSSPQRTSLPRVQNCVGEIGKRERCAHLQLCRRACDTTADGGGVAVARRSAGAVNAPARPLQSGL